MQDKGSISRKKALQKAECEYDAFNKTQKVTSDFDREIEKLLSTRNGDNA